MRWTTAVPIQDHTRSCSCSWLCSCPEHRMSALHFLVTSHPEPTWIIQQLSPVPQMNLGRKLEQNMDIAEETTVGSAHSRVSWESSISTASHSAWTSCIARSRLRENRTQEKGESKHEGLEGRHCEPFHTRRPTSENWQSVGKEVGGEWIRSSKCPTL
jgi:hypothetical protein